MYVVPRPEVNDDPLHAVRLASMAVDISYAYFDPRVKLGDD